MLICRRHPPAGQQGAYRGPPGTNENGLQMIMSRPRGGTPRRSAPWAQAARGRGAPGRNRRGKRGACRGALPPTGWPSSRRRRCRSMTPPTYVAALQARFPNIVGPHKERQICYATTNRAGGGEGHGPARPTKRCWWWVRPIRRIPQKRLVEVGRRPSRAAAMRSCATGDGHRLARAGGHPLARHHGRRFCARGAGQRGSSTPSASGSR